jgi:bifunctional non-homologous end joining protein LigD
MRPPIPAHRRRTPPGFIAPCLACPADRVPTGPLWVHSPKHDGFRMVCRREGPQARLWSRNALNWTQRLPRIAGGLLELPCASCVLDGEAVVQLPDGRDDFHALRSKAGAQHAMLMAFDLLELDGRDLRPLPLEERRAELRRLVETTPVDGVAFVDATDEDGEALFRHACRLGLEGIVSKRRDSPYRSGRSQAWLKSKCASYIRHGER